MKKVPTSKEIKNLLEHHFKNIIRSVEEHDLKIFKGFGSGVENAHFVTIKMITSDKSSPISNLSLLIKYQAGEK